MALSDLIDAWDQACHASDALFRHVSPRGLWARPIGERHRVLFYRGHLEAFDFNLLGAAALRLPSHDATLDRLFARGIDPTDGGLPQDVPEDWPHPDQIAAYALRVRHALRAALLRQGMQNVPAHTLRLICEHRWMHVETLTYMLHHMAADCLNMPHEAEMPQVAPLVAPAMRHVPAGSTSLGQKRTSGSFGWDNEFDAHRQDVEAFSIDTFPVTNGEYLQFMQAGGYADRALWRPQDWNWMCRQRDKHPRFWRRDGDAWKTVAFGESRLWNPDAPAAVSFAEAHAYATFCDKTLPTEAQWQRASTGTPEGRETLYPWGDGPPLACHGNFGRRMRGTCSVYAHPAGASAFGLHDMIGNGWEWTRTPFAPFAGFAADPDYPGYSADFFDDAHYVLKGGSQATAEPLLRRSFRNWFQPHYPYVYAKFRCVKKNP